MTKFLLELLAKIINEVIFGEKMTRKIDGEYSVTISIEYMTELLWRSLF